MNEEAAFLAAICAEPADDTPRLVYADWLQEHGQEDRAEFIRVQVEMARLASPKEPPPGGAQLCANTGSYRHPVWVAQSDLPQFNALYARQVKVFDAEPARVLRWFGLPRPWARIVRLAPFDIEDLRYPYGIALRGFLDCFTMGPASWFDHGDRIRELHPVVTVRLIERPEFEHLEIGHCSQELRSADGPTKLVPMQTTRAVVAGRLIVLPPTPPSTDPTLDLLSARWKGVKFELPMVRGALTVYEMPGHTAGAADLVLRQFIVRGTDSPGEASGTVGIPINAPHRDRPELRVSRIEATPVGDGEWVVMVRYERSAEGEGQ